MRCSKCGLDMRIKERSQILFEGDDSPDTETKAFYELTFTCENRQCPDYKKEDVEKETVTEKFYLE